MAENATTGALALEQHAASAARTWAEIEAAAWTALASKGRIDLADLAARVAASQHGLPPIARPTATGPSPWQRVDAAHWRGIESLASGERDALAFAEQLAFDVASLGAKERGALFAALGAAAPDFAQLCYVADLAPRVRAALDALFGAGAWPGREIASPPPLAEAFDAWIRVVPQLLEVDAVTTELVRLLGARRHHCRVCLSVRSRSALVLGANDAMFDAVGHFASSELTASHKAALAFAEAMLASPFAVDDALARELRAHFSPAACVEIVLDIARNATNKVAVALGGDAPRVETGYEIYDVGPDGEIHYGLEAP